MISPFFKAYLNDNEHCFLSASLWKPDWKLLFKPRCLSVASVIVRIIRVNGKPEKSEHKLLQPASPVSHGQPSHGRWAPQPLTLNQPFPSHPLEQIYALQKSSSPFVPFYLPAPVFCSCDQSRRWPWRKFTRTREVSVYSINIFDIRKEIWCLQRCSWYLTLWLMFKKKKKKILFVGSENISLTVRWSVSFVSLGQSCGLVMWIPEIFHYLSWWCF